MKISYRNYPALQIYDKQRCKTFINTSDYLDILPYNKKGECVMFFDDVNSIEAETFPDCVSERECLHQIGIALQAIANNKTMKEQLIDSAGNFERYEID